MSSTTLPVYFLIFTFEDLDTYKLLLVTYFAEGPLIWVCPIFAYG